MIHEESLFQRAYIQVKGDRSREGDHYQDSHEGSRGHSSRSSSSRADLEDRGEYNIMTTIENSSNS